MASTTIFGSVFVDVKGFSSVPYVPTGRNIGNVQFVHGGVCRNVCEDFANQGVPVTFVSMAEDTAIGRDVRERLESRGADLRYMIDAENGIGMWLAILDENGDLAGSISRQPDFTMLEKLVHEKGVCPAIPSNMIDSTGAGDAFFAGAVMALTRGAKLSKAVCVGTRLASETIQCSESTCPHIDCLFDDEQTA